MVELQRSRGSRNNHDGLFPLPLAVQIFANYYNLLLKEISKNLRLLTAGAEGEVLYY